MGETCKVDLSLRVFESFNFSYLQTLECEGNDCHFLERVSIVKLRTSTYLRSRRRRFLVSQCMRAELRIAAGNFGSKYEYPCIFLCVISNTSLQIIQHPVTLLD